MRNRVTEPGHAPTSAQQHERSERPRVVASTSADAFAEHVSSERRLGLIWLILLSATAWFVIFAVAAAVWNAL